MTTYTVQDSGSSDSNLSYDEAMERIAEWYEDVDTWHTGSGDDDLHDDVAKAIASVERPDESGGLADLQDYADSIREAVAEAMGSRAFAGHGNYYVSAAAEGGFDLRVDEDAE